MERILHNELKASEDLFNQFNIIYAESLKIWEEQYLREYTTHGAPHTRQVERNLDALTRPIQNSDVPLSSQEIFVLLSACCLHDIGMQLPDDPDARAKHAQAAYELILNSSVEVGMEERRVLLTIHDEQAREAIACIARAHWTEFALQLKPKDVVYGNETGRRRLLGTLLAMADLLDLSPVRGRFFRSPYRLYSLPPKSQLHQTMHNLVRYFDIAQVGSSKDLQFQLHWWNNTAEVRELSDWVMGWFQSQWKLLQQVLYEESKGYIRWSNPWATVSFRQPDPVEKSRQLGPEAYYELQAQRAEEERIDRNALINKFKNSIQYRSRSLYLFPRDSFMDGSKLSDWCYAQARLVKKCFVARIDIPPHALLDTGSIAAQVIIQWKEQLPPEKRDDSDFTSSFTSSRRSPLKGLKSFIEKYKEYSFISIIVTETYLEKVMSSLLQILLKTVKKDSPGARICLLLTSGAEGPGIMDNVVIERFDGSAFSREDVLQYLQARLAFSQAESENIYKALASSGFADKPSEVYNYIATHWKLFSGNYFVESSP